MWDSVKFFVAIYSTRNLTWCLSLIELVLAYIQVLISTTFGNTFKLSCLNFIHLFEFDHRQ